MAWYRGGAPAPTCAAAAAVLVLCCASRASGTAHSAASAAERIAARVPSSARCSTTRVVHCDRHPRRDQDRRGGGAAGRRHCGCRRIASQEATGRQATSRRRRAHATGAGVVRRPRKSRVRSRATLTLLAGKESITDVIVNKRAMPRMAPGELILVVRSSAECVRARAALDGDHHAGR